MWHENLESELYLTLRVFVLALYFHNSLSPSKNVPSRHRERSRNSLWDKGVQIILCWCEWRGPVSSCPSFWLSIFVRRWGRRFAPALLASRLPIRCSAARPWCRSEEHTSELQS